VTDVRSGLSLTPHQETNYIKLNYIVYMHT
jgi:hypothetical protein